MHIGGGMAKRRQLRTLPGQRVRPTSGWVRQALFNVLRGIITDATFVDLFAGTGSVGLEALSHGAQRALFVEQDTHALHVLRDNIQRCAMTAQTTVVVGTLPQALSKLSAYRPVDIIFLDPPYASHLGEQMLTALSGADLLAPHGIVIWQHAMRRPVLSQVPGVVLWQKRCYGDTQLSFYKRMCQDGDGAESGSGKATFHA
jgi:16S rRNA (guanine966-N2)-methyltransferase